jgi:hypothetical protein
MKIGLVARCDERGLGYLTHGFYRAMRPERTLVVDMSNIARGFAQRYDWYPGEQVVPFDGHYLPELQCRSWLRGLDVVYLAETAYDWRFVEWAHELGVATVCMSMAEFWKHPHQPELPMPTQVWAPTSWRLDLLPAGTPVVPVPVEQDVFPLEPAGIGDRLQVVHVAGHRAAGDRNGTLALLVAAQRVSAPMDIYVHTQDEHLPRLRSLKPGVTVHMLPGGKRSRPELYAGMHLHVLPRRYGGLCLPAQESLASGLGLAMTLTPPNAQTWPLVGLRGHWEGRQATPSGEVRSFAADAVFLARTLDTLARNPERVAELQTAGVTWAKANAWSELAPMYRERLASACR